MAMNLSKVLLSLQERIAAYLEEVEILERNRKPMEGIFGMKGGPKDDPCHDRFVKELDQLLKEFLNQEPDSAEARDVLRELFLAADSHRNAGSAFWMLLGVQGLGLELVDRLNHQDAEELHHLLQEKYLRRERFPVQKQILKKLKSIIS